ncbi:hypothetical protein SCP_0400070 [Sparassis crispa]|uniref:Uncharacterized protein n=1 Tax=Sparassis crispa TaxID=139825 RepID=A0A401GHG4_9APHY|nr:hypothetical protein SCP_0400070 [Sparassis crispa]GBE81636.1 hypothetical protein SCP_0400070 [Sparassis crispa]
MPDVPTPLPHLVSQPCDRPTDRPSPALRRRPSEPRSAAVARSVCAPIKNIFVCLRCTFTAISFPLSATRSLDVRSPELVDFHPADGGGGDSVAVHPNFLLSVSFTAPALPRRSTSAPVFSPQFTAVHVLLLGAGTLRLTAVN